MSRRAVLAEATVLVGVVRNEAMNQLVITPDNEAIDELKQAWSWLLPEHYQPILFTALGDMFFQVPSGDVHWLNTGTGEVTQVAANLSEFERHLETDLAVDWLLPDLIEQLVAAGKVLQPGQCYGFTILPIFREGTYTIDNLRPMSAKEHFVITGGLHKAIQDVPDGAKVQFKQVE